MNFRDYQLPTINQYNVTHSKILETKSKVPAGKLINENNISFKFSTIDYDIIIYKDMFNEMLEACKNGNIDSIKKFINNDYNLNEQNSIGATPLIMACSNGRFDIIDLLITNGADIDTSDYNGKTPIMYAYDYCLKCNDYSLIRILNSYGIDKSNSDCTE